MGRDKKQGNLQATYVTNSSVELEWENNTGQGDLSFEIHRRFRGVETVAFVGSSTRKIITNLLPDTTHTFLVKGFALHADTDDVNGTESEAIFIDSVTIRTKSKPSTPDELYKAIKLGNTREVEHIVAASNAFVNTPNEHNESPLVMAMNRGHIDIVDLLLAYGADPLQTDGRGKSLVAIICYGGKLSFLKTVYSHKPNLWELCASRRVYSMHRAVDGGNLELISWMLLNGANVDEKDEENGWTPLFRLAVYGGSAKVGRLLVRHGANVNACDKYGCTVIMAATLSGFQELVECLVLAGADLKIRSKYGRSVIDFARAFERSDILRTLTKAKESQKNNF